MGLDRFMEPDSKKPEKKTKKKSTGKKTSTNKPKVQKEERKPQIKEIDNPTEPSKKKVSEIENPPSFTFVTMKFKCTNSKCKMKKTIRKPQSFTPTEKELICPKCGSPLKKSRAK
ncbi:MAG: hypothetical protein ACTSRD_12410 [Promethearchaeota archaeon]